MKKRNGITLINVWRWAFNAIDNTDDISKWEQLTLFHVMDRLNSNEWQPTKISLKKIAANMNTDRRTVEKSLNALIDKKLLVKNADKYNVTLKGEKDNDTDKSSVEYSQTESGTGEPVTVDGRANAGNDAVPAEIESSDEFNFKYFNGE